MFPRSLLVCAVVGFLAPARGWADPPGPGVGHHADGGPVPGLYLGSNSRGYPYYPGFRWYPGYPLYRAYPDYFGYPDYPGLSYRAGYQPANPYLLECFGLRPALWKFPDYYSGNFPAYYAATPDFRGAAADPGPVPPPGARACVSVRVPAGAEVWFEGKKMSASGPVRRFNTPPLAPGNRYTYDVIARWQEDGRPVTRSQSVYVTAGADVDVVFAPRPIVSRNEESNSR